jgi:glycerol kinase
VAWKRDGVTDYALEGSVFIGGAVVQWLRDGLKLIRSAAEVEASPSMADNGGVYLVPAFAGLGAPHWDAYARGAMFGLTRGSTGAHIARAALEAIAYQSAEVLAAMEADAGIKLAELRVDGGATANNLLMQFQADLLGVAVVRPKVLETTALGAAISPDWRSATGATHASSPRTGRSTGASGRRCRATELQPDRGLEQAVARAKNWATIGPGGSL